jgi:putative transcriptional regulator
VLQERGLKRASEISRLIGERTGYQLSIQAVCDLLNTEPKMIRLETIQAFCDAFYFRLGDVLDVLPSAAEKRRKRIGNQDFAAFYPNARNYSSESWRGD